MKKILNILLLIIIFSSFAYGQDVAPINTYIAAQGHKLSIFFAEYQDGRGDEIHEATISNINSNSVSVSLKIYQKKKVVAEGIRKWEVSRNFIEKNQLKGIKELRRDYYNISGVDLPCLVVKVGTTELWVAMSEADTTFPGIVFFKKNDKILIRLLKIENMKQIRKF